MTTAAYLNQEKKYNLFTYMLFFMYIIALIWLVAKQVPAGFIYLGLTFGAVVILFMTRNVQSPYPIHYPIEKSETRATFGFFIAIALIITLLITQLFGFQGFAVVQKYINPGFIFSAAGDPTQGRVPFSVLSTINDPFWSWFTVVFAAGVGEELTFMIFYIGFLFVAIWAVAKFKWLQLFGEDSKIIHIILAVIMTGVFFAILHSFNPIYGTINDFLIAAAFRVALTLLTFYIFGISFAIGLHMAINAGYLGADAAIAALFFNPGGYLILGVFALAMLGFWTAIKQERQEAINAFKDFNMQRDE